MPSPLPFLEEKKQSGTTGPTQYFGDDSGLEACAHELIKAVAAGDAKGVASALKNAFQLVDSQPHTEGPHE